MLFCKCVTGKPPIARQMGPKFSSKIIALFTLIYEFIDIFYDMGKKLKYTVGGQPEEHILVFQEHVFNCVTVAKPCVGKFIHHLP